MQRWRRHCKSGLATANKRLLIYVHGRGAVTRRGRLRSRNTANSGMRHIANSFTSYTHVYVGADPAQSGRAGLLIRRQKSVSHYEKRVHAGQRWACWTNRLVLRLSLQSGNETNGPLKSGPAKAGPAGAVTPPLPWYLSSRSVLAMFTIAKRPRSFSVANFYLTHPFWSLHDVLWDQAVKQLNGQFVLAVMSCSEPWHKTVFYSVEVEQEFLLSSTSFNLNPCINTLRKLFQVHVFGPLTDRGQWG